jgi:replicative DNA helicase
MIDKDCIIQIFGTLMKNPSLLSNTEKYNLSTLDFPPGLDKYIFNAIQGLYEGGANKIRAIDIENYAQSYEAFKIFFNQQHGLEYLQDAEELSQEDNFDYYYTRLKKLNLLRDLKKSGIDTSEYLVENLTDPKALEINANFECLSIKDIVSGLKTKLLKIEGNYLKDDVTETEKASDGIEELLKNISENPDIGLPIQGEIFNEIINGARKGTLCIRSGGSGVSKTRQAVGDACYLAYPFRFNPETVEWEKNGSNEKVLFIATEQNFNEIRRMILAYLTGMNESKFRYGHFSELEKKTIVQARFMMEMFENNFMIVRMPNPTIELVKMIVRENVLLNEVGYIFYDYIFIGPSLLNEFKGFNLRNDKILSYI